MVINCDMGESFGPWKMGDDEAIMPHIDWANIACGGHAGDPDTMARTLALAHRHGVMVGAHPGFPDRRNFGRRNLDLPIESLVNEIQAQVGALSALALAEGLRLNHVKPHGALYNTMMQDFGLLVRIAQGIAAVDASLTFVLQAMPNREMHEMALRNTGLNLAFEAFADRRYEPDGRLRSRSEEDAVILDPDDAEAHVRDLLAGRVMTGSGALAITANTICVHGDNPHAVDIVRRIRALVPRE